jgi:hypothetical protein
MSGKPAPPGPSEAMVSLAAIAAQVPDVRLGTLLTAATFRHPGLLAIQAANIDEISGDPQRAARLLAAAGAQLRASGSGWLLQAAEAAAYPAELRSGESLVPVNAGERISERQALEALLLPSADNMAWILARWDAGRQARFVARMNATARALGMTATRYTDPPASPRPPSAAPPTRSPWARRPCTRRRWQRSHRCVPLSSQWPGWSPTSTPCSARTESPGSRPAATPPPADASCWPPGGTCAAAGAGS